MRTGRFLVTPEKTVAGELRIAGPESSIVLRDDELINVDHGPDLCLTGELYDQTRITLVDCIRTSSQTRTMPGEGLRAHTLTLFPHFIVQGQAHLAPKCATIRSASFTFEDAPTLFCDFDAFGALVDSTPYIKSLTEVNERLYQRPIRTGPYPHIAYFAGEDLIAEANTMIGTVSARHRPSFPIAGPRGVRIDNEIWVTIEPEAPVTLEEATDRILTLLRFITIAVGRRQSVPSFSIEVPGSSACRNLEVFWSHHPRRYRDSGREGREPHSFDMPLDPVRRPEEFRKVVTAWITFDSERRDARVRMDDSFTLLNFYPIDRLVGAANAFDLLPAGAVPKAVELSKEVEAAGILCKHTFYNLPDSDDRRALFDAVGRLGRASLKRKVRHRAQIILKAGGSVYFPELEFVCGQAVEARNHYVHGSSVKWSRERPFRTFDFLTNTLEFVFTASEFIESGWDITRAVKAGTTMTHPFGSYAATYRQNLEHLKTSIKASAAEDH